CALGGRVGATGCGLLDLLQGGGSLHWVGQIENGLDAHWSAGDGLSHGGAQGVLPNLPGGGLGLCPGGVFQVEATGDFVGAFGDASLVTVWNLAATDAGQVGAGLLCLPVQFQLGIDLAALSCQL